MNYRYGDAILVCVMRRHGYAVFRARFDFSKCAKHHITRLHLADAFLIRAAVAGEPRCMLGKHVARKIDLKSPAARVVFFLSEMIVSWNVHVVCGSVLVERRSALKFL